MTRTDLNTPFFAPPLPRETLPLPSGGSFEGARVEWQTCPFSYVLEAGAVDELDKVDGTPAALDFSVGGPPVMDSVYVPPVVVFVPTCPLTMPFLCPSIDQGDFGPDTLLVFGSHVPDDISDGLQTPLGLGWNDFVFPFRAWAHDHPRDRNAAEGPEYYERRNVGRIRAWRYEFDCTETACQDLVVPGEGTWRAEVPAAGDPTNQQVFDEDLTIRVALDTLCLSGCTVDDLRAWVPTSRYGAYVFTIEGRDTDPFGQSCSHPSDLGDNASWFTISISAHGHETEKVSRDVVWVQLSDVRPLAKQQASTAFAAPRRLMQ
ncbi:MAG: hypothetical protein ACE5G2_01835 [Candidatus Krumholzibacteriia bacterium]